MRKGRQCGRVSVFSRSSMVTCLVQKRASIVVYVDPEIQLSIAVSKVACFVECFAVFPERSAWRCEGVDWIQSYNAILPLRCLSLHLFTSGGAFSNYRNVASKASIKNRPLSFLRREGTAKAEAAKLPDAGIGPKQCPGKCVTEKGEPTALSKIRHGGHGHISNYGVGITRSSSGLCD